MITLMYASDTLRALVLHLGLLNIQINFQIISCNLLLWAIVTETLP